MNKITNTEKMKHWLTTLFVLNTLIGFGQVDLFFPLTKEFEWTSLEKQNQELKEKFIKEHIDEFEYYRTNEKYMPTMSDLENCVHIMDFNGDGLDDIIFNGTLGTEPDYVVIYINTGKSFVKIFEETQKIHKMVFENGKVSRLYIQDNGCCCETIGTNKIFNVDYSCELPKINLLSQMQYLNNRATYNGVAQYPSNYFEKLIKFEVLNDRYNIRFSPILDDTTEVCHCGEPANGNSLGKIKSGSIGYALAEKTDSTGLIWWYVAMSPNTELYESLYIGLQYRPNDYRIGWISSRFVKKIDE